MSEQRFRSVALLLCHGVFITLVVLALQHWRMRVAYVDSAYQVFKWIDKPEWNIEAYRYSAILPQALVKLLAVSGASVRNMLMAASAAHVLVGYVIFLVLAYGFRSLVQAIGVTVATVLCTRLTFYGMVLEANYLLCYPFLVFGFWSWISLHSRRIAWWHHVMGACLLVPVLMVHPMGWPIMLYGVAWYALNERRTWSLMGSAVVIIAVWAIWNRTWFPVSDYEMDFYHTMEQGIDRLDRFWSWPSTEYVIDHTVAATSNFLLLWIVLLASLLALTLQRRFLSAVLVLLAVMGFLFVNLLSTCLGQEAMMMEKSVLPVASIVALPFADVLVRSARRWAWAALFVLMAVLVLRVRVVSMVSRNFVPRTDAIVHVIADARAQGHQVMRISSANADRYGLERTWALTFETVLLSAADRSGPCVTVMPMEDEQVAPDGGIRNAPFWYYVVNSGFDQRYFPVPNMRPGDMPVLVPANDG
ncbi:MAG: hypothetical protein H6595_13420 [Flavobacteriales bacterium]|nr:hypothetical protein [Flavobacteriales bacterium]MCB9168466.1 hypothetical protein [Flavobacteriales bacterium]